MPWAPQEILKISWLLVWGREGGEDIDLRMT